jgi:hypothetical protein
LRLFSAKIQNNNLGDLKRIVFLSLNVLSA